MREGVWKAASRARPGVIFTVVLATEQTVLAADGRMLAPAWQRRSAAFVAHHERRCDDYDGT